MARPDALYVEQMTDRVFTGPLAEVADTFAQLDTWGTLVKTFPTIEQGSPLSEDDQVFECLSSGDLTWQALCGAQDHLKGFRAWLRSGELFPIATCSLLRGALVGGALAAWILRPDDSETRTTRSLIAADDWYTNHLKWGNGMTEYAADRKHHEDQLAHVTKRLDQVRGLREGRTPRWRT